MRGLVFVLPLLLLAGCKWSPGCLIEDKVVTGLSNALVTELQCSNPDAVKKDIGAAFGKLGLCPKQALTGPIADFACPLVAGWAVNGLADKAIPKAWGCTAENAKAKAMAVFTSACRLIPF